MNIQKIIESEGNQKTFYWRGIECFIQRHERMGHLCGYVGIPKESYLFGKHYSSEVFDTIDVHGGLTYSKPRKPTEQPDGKWWIGFDCAQLEDMVPNLDHFREGEYRTMEYVEAECISLADQIAELLCVGPSLSKAVEQVRNQRIYKAQQTWAAKNGYDLGDVEFEENDHVLHVYSKRKLLDKISL